MIEIKSCPVCWGKGKICIGLKDDLEPILKLCAGCDGTGWIAFKTVDTIKEVNMENTKRWFHSKSLWVMGLTLIGSVIAGITGENWLDGEMQLTILSLIGIILRLKTGQGLTK